MRQLLLPVHGGKYAVASRNDSIERWQKSDELHPQKAAIRSASRALGFKSGRSVFGQSPPLTRDPRIDVKHSRSSVWDARHDLAAKGMALNREFIAGGLSTLVQTK